MSKVSEDSLNKQLRIQLGICKRMVKEVSSYEKEVIVNEARIQKMRDDGKDSYDIRKQEEVLQESYMMIPDSKSRLEKAIYELSTIMNDVTDPTKIDQEILKQAKEMMILNDNNIDNNIAIDDNDEPL